MERTAKKFMEISVGDELPAFTINETQETIDNAVLDIEGIDFNPRNIHNDPDFAKLSGEVSTSLRGSHS